MANPNWASGLRPVGNGKGGTAPRITKYVQATSAEAFEGAPMITPAEPAMPGTTAAMYAANVCIGVMGHYSSTGAADTDLYIYDDPDQEYLVQLDGLITDASAVTVKEDAIGCFAILTAGTEDTGTAATLQSNATLDASTVQVAAATDFPLQIVRLWEAEDNNYALVNAKVVVKIIPLSHVFG